MGYLSSLYLSVACAWYLLLPLLDIGETKMVQRLMIWVTEALRVRLRHVNNCDYGPGWVDDAVSGLRSDRNETKQTNNQIDRRQLELSVLYYGNVRGPQRKSLALAFLHHLLSFPATPNPRCKHKVLASSSSDQSHTSATTPAKNVSIFQTWLEGTDTPTYSKPHQVLHNGPKEAGASRTASVALRD